MASNFTIEEENDDTRAIKMKRELILQKKKNH